MKKLNITEAELKKSVAYKKKRVVQDFYGTFVNIQNTDFLQQLLILC